MSSLQFQHTPYQSFASSTARSNGQPKALSPTARVSLPQSTPRSTTISPEHLRSLIKSGKVSRRDHRRQSGKKPSAIPRHIVEEIKHTPQKDIIDVPEVVPVPIEQTTNETSMSPRSTKYSPPSSKASSPGAPSTTTKKTKTSGSKEVDWAEVTDPEERRRIQNRIAQRKFREKARENKEKAEREMRNQENAGNSYRIPTADDFMNDSEPAGLPWGSVNLSHILTRGHEIEGRKSSGRGTYVGDDPYRSNFYPVSYGHGIPQAPSYGSSGTDDAYMEEPTYVYSPVLQTFAPPIVHH